ncbi:mitogen-activated protein kinase kinase kinase ANP1-like protein, partial [Tanacetum coccineum]
MFIISKDDAYLSLAPQVIFQTGHSIFADIWSAGCTLIEMAIGKPPRSQQYQK